MAKTINNNALTPGATYLVRGQVGFSRITRQTTDAEREAENKRRMYPQTTNYSNISIYNAQVLVKDPQNPTIEEKYAAECLYRSSSQNYPGNNFTAMNKTKNLPAVAEIRGANNFAEIIPEHELAQGLDVTLVMRVFKTSGQRNNGVSLDRILVNEPIRYFQNRDVNQDLAAYGITYQALPTANQTADGLNQAAAEAAAAASADDVPAFGTVNPVGNNTPQTPVQEQVTYTQGTEQANPGMVNTPFSSYSSAPAPGQLNPGAGRTY